MANDFGPTITTLASTDVDATTKWPLSKSGAHNQILSSDVLASVTNTTVLPSGAVIPNVLIVQQDSGTPGSDQVNISHDGSRTQILSKDGPTRFTSVAGIPNNTLEGVWASDTSNAAWSLGLGSSGDGTLYLGSYSISTKTVGMQGGSGGVIGLASGATIIWTNSAASGLGSTQDAGLGRTAPGVVKFTDGGSGNGFPQGRDTRVASDIPNATVTMANITGLSETVTAGDKYGFEITAKVGNTTATEGVRFDLDGGTATVTSFAARLSVDEGGTTVLGNVVTSALATDLVVTTATGETWVTIKGAFVCNAGGTFIPRFAESTTAIGTATIYTNTQMNIWRLNN